MNLRRHLPACVLALALGAALAGCGLHETPVEKANRENILLVGNGDDPRSLDPQFITSFEEYRIVMALFEGLTNADPVTLEPRPAVAQSWDYDDKTLTWTFHLRPNAQWSNGDPLTAGDFVYSYQRMLTPELGAEYANMLYPIRGARDFHQGKTKDFSTVGVKALDDHTLQIQLEHPTGYFLSLLYHQTYFPVHPPTIKKFNAFTRPDSPWTHEGNLVGNGPFALQRYALGDTVEVVKNPRYWNAANVRLNGIHFLFIKSIQAEERAFRAGQLHITNSLPTNRVVTYREERSPFLRISPWYAVYYYLFNVTKPPLDNPKVRLALNLAIDRQAITERILRGGQAPAFNFTPPSTSYTSRSQLKEDVAEAKRLLAEAGYPDGKGLPPVELLYNTSEMHRAIAEAVQQMWHDNLNIDITLVNVSAPAYFARRTSGEFQVARAGWIADFLDPATFLEQMTGDNPLNNTRWKSPRYDEFVASAMKESDPVKRMEYFQQAEAVLTADVPFMPIYFYARIYLIRPEVRGWEPNLLDQHTWQNVYLDLSRAGAAQP